MEKATWERGWKYASSLEWELNQNHPYVYFFLKKKHPDWFCKGDFARFSSDYRLIKYYT